MNKQSGMTLLEVLLAMSIFTAVALTLMSSMQGQRNAIERMRNETLALWIADNQLQSQDSFGEEKHVQFWQRVNKWRRVELAQRYPLKQRRHASGTHHNGDITQRSDNLAYALSKHR